MSILETWGAINMLFWRGTRIGKRSLGRQWNCQEWRHRHPCLRFIDWRDGEEEGADKWWSLCEWVLLFPFDDGSHAWSVRPIRQFDLLGSCFLQHLMQWFIVLRLVHFYLFHFKQQTQLSISVTTRRLLLLLLLGPCGLALLWLRNSSICTLCLIGFEHPWPNVEHQRKHKSHKKYANQTEWDEQIVIDDDVACYDRNDAHYHRSTA